MYSFLYTTPAVGSLILVVYVANIPAKPTQTQGK